MSLSYSVITIARNAGSTIDDTLESVLSQTPPPSQYLLIDGGSEDGTLARIDAARRRAPADTAVVVQAQAACAPGAAGIPSAWNQALRQATGDIIFILNADDWYEPDAARRVLAAFAAAPDTDVVVTPIHYRQAPGGAVLRCQRPRRLRWLPLLMPLPHPGCFVRRSLYDRLGLYDERYAVSADYDFVYRAARAGAVFTTLDEAVVSMRPGGFARQRLSLARRETFAIARRHGAGLVAGLVAPGAAFLARWLLNR